MVTLVWFKGLCIKPDHSLSVVSLGVQNIQLTLAMTVEGDSLNSTLCWVAITIFAAHFSGTLVCLDIHMNNVYLPPLSDLFV